MGHDPPLGALGHHRLVRGTTGLAGPPHNFQGTPHTCQVHHSPQTCQEHHQPSRGTSQRHHGPARGITRLLGAPPVQQGHNSPMLRKKFEKKLKTGHHRNKICRDQFFFLILGIGRGTTAIHDPHLGVFFSGSAPSLHSDDIYLPRIL